MAEDKSNRGPADRARINIHEPYESGVLEQGTWRDPWNGFASSSANMVS